MYAHQAQGASIRARAKYYIEGEHPTRLFCSLKKHNGVQKHIPKLIVDKDGSKNHITDQKSIENTIYDYYSDLFSSKPTEIETICDFFFENVESSSCPQLSTVQKEEMEGMLTIFELTKYVKK